MASRKLVAAVILLVAASAALADDSGGYLVGIGRGDITGPAAEVNLMGYALLAQTARGLHTRQWARAFVFAEEANPRSRFLLVVVDACMASQVATMRVVERLQDAAFGGLYNTDNVVLTATHTHAAAGGVLEHLLYHVTSLGMVRQSFNSFVDGVVEAALQAHTSLAPAGLSWVAGELLGANINRSPTAYQANPAAERARYAHDVDKELLLLKVEGRGSDTRGRGLLTWFPVHATSIGNTNRLLSGDNKGAAQQLLEKRWAPAEPRLAPGFTAAFAQSSAADTSPNVNGTFCRDSGLPCDAATSTCGGRNSLCIGRGPAYPDDIASAAAIGERQADKAKELWAQPAKPISGPLEFRHLFYDIANASVGEGGHTCSGAMGYSFAAGTTDGPGVDGFFQAEPQAALLQHPSRWTPLSAAINAALLAHTSAAEAACQLPKPVLLNIGEALRPYPWVPRVTEMSLLRLGSFFVVFAPGEFTTMAGRRLREAVHSELAAAYGPDIKIVVSSLSNTYSSYVTTPEEYAVQRYEGASTLYGPNTLAAHLQAATRLARSLAAGAPLASAASPVDFSAKTFRLLPPVLLDTPPPGKRFGAVLAQPARQAYPPGETVEASFVSANPRNNLRRYGTFLEVQRWQPAHSGGSSSRHAAWFEPSRHSSSSQAVDGSSASGSAGAATSSSRASSSDASSSRVSSSSGGGAWVAVHSDDDWCTRFEWDRPGSSLSESRARISWAVPADAAPGRYRLVHYGTAKGLLGLSEFSGASRPFEVLAPA